MDGRGSNSGRCGVGGGRARRFWGHRWRPTVGCGERDGGIGHGKEALADRIGASWRGRWGTGGRAPSAWEWKWLAVGPGRG